MNWRKYSIVFNAVTLLLGWLFTYCGWGGYEPPSSFFAPEVATGGKRDKLFYEPNSVYYTGFKATGFDNSQSTLPYDFGEINSMEWKAYFNNALSVNEINYFLDHISAGKADSSLKFLTGNIKNLKDSILKHHIQKITDKRKAIAFFTYLNYALHLQQKLYRQWDYEYYYEVDTFILNNDKKLLTGMQQKLYSEPDPFIKERYCFQIERLLFRLEKFEEGIAFWKANRTPQIENSSYYRFVGYAAACYNRTRDFNESNYLYSLIFDKYPPMQSAALWSFGFREQWDLKGCLKKAKSDYEKCVIWQMYGYDYDVKEAIAGIYQLNPKAPMLSILLTRLVNMEESEFIQNGYSFDFKKSVKGLNALKAEDSTYQLVERIANSNNTLKPELWHLVAAYFNIINNDFVLANNHLTLAKKQDKKDDLYARQWHVIQILYDIRSGTAVLDGNESVSPEFEKKLVDHFKWLDDVKKDSFLRTDDLLLWCKTYLADIYRSKGNFIAAECFRVFSVRDFYSKENIDLILGFLQKSNKTDFEKLISKLYQFGAPDLIKLKIYRLLYSGKFQEANSLYKSNSNVYTTIKLPADPFLIHIKDCHDCDFAAPKNIKYNEFDLIHKLAQLQTLALANPNDASGNYFLMANALYNITYFGNSRDFYKIPMNLVYNNYDEYTTPEDSSIISLPIFDCRLSESYYRKSLEASKDKEFRTRCLFMIAKCRQNEEYRLGGTERDRIKINDQNFVPRDTIFYQLKTQYSDTKYYQQIIKECGYFNYVINKN